MTGLSAPRQVTAGLTEAIAAGARQDRACAVLGLSARTVQRGRQDESVRSESASRAAAESAPQAKRTAADRSSGGGERSGIGSPAAKPDRPTLGGSG